jgi:hypothetical protein
MRHARADDLGRLTSLLTELRAIEALVEKRPGTFYRRSKGFLHFHIDGDDVFADVKLTGSEFERMRVTTKSEQRTLMAAIRRVLSGA